MTRSGLYPDVIRVESPIALYSVSRVWLWIEPIRERIFSDKGPTSIEEFLEVEYSPSIKTWAVTKDDDIVAVAFAHATDEPGVVGLRMYWRKASVLVEALRIITAEILAMPNVHRIEWRAWWDAVNVLNVSRQAGGTRESLMKKSALRGGVPTDQIMIVWTKE